LLPLSDRDYASNEPTVLGYVDRLPVPDPRQHFARVMAQVPQADGMNFGSHVP